MLCLSPCCNSYHGIHNLTEKDGDAMLHVEMEPGDTLFFHPFVFLFSMFCEMRVTCAHIMNVTVADTVTLLCSVLFLCSLLIHGSGRNNSQRYRKAISCHYASTHCEFYEVKGTMQEEIATEIEGIAARRGVQVSFQDVWRLKSRLIKGNEDTL